MQLPDKITLELSIWQLNDELPSLSADVDELNQAIDDAKQDAPTLVNELQKRLRKAETRLATHRETILSTETELFFVKRQN